MQTIPITTAPSIPKPISNTVKLSLMHRAGKGETSKPFQSMSMDDMVPLFITHLTPTEKPATPPKRIIDAKSRRRLNKKKLHEKLHPSIIRVTRPLLISKTASAESPPPESIDAASTVSNYSSDTMTAKNIAQAAEPFENILSAIGSQNSSRVITPIPAKVSNQNFNSIKANANQNFDSIKVNVLESLKVNESDSHNSYNDSSTILENFTNRDKPKNDEEILGYFFQLSITWEDAQVDQEFHREYLLDLLPIQAWETGEFLEDPGVLHALKIGEASGVGYEYIDKAEFDVSIFTLPVSKESNAYNQSKLKESNRVFEVMTRLPTVVSEVSFSATPNNSPQLQISKYLVHYDQRLQDPISGFQVSPKQRSTETRRNGRIPINSLPQYQQASLFKNDDLPPLKIFSKGYVSQKLYSYRNGAEQAFLRRSENPQVHTRPRTQIVYDTEDALENPGKTITIRNWQLESIEKTSETDLPVIGSKDDFLDLPTLGTIGLLIKPIVPVAGTVRRAKKDAVWGPGGKRRGNKK